jgi:hypothetical protein
MAHRPWEKIFISWNEVEPGPSSPYWPEALGFRFRAFSAAVPVFGGNKDCIDAINRAHERFCCISPDSVKSRADFHTLRFQMIFCNDCRVSIALDGGANNVQNPLTVTIIVSQNLMSDAANTAVPYRQAPAIDA